jgi:DNA-binding NarL/FixJ family response regulator
MTIRVVIVDDHAVFREGLRAVLHGHADIEVVAEAGDGLHALDVVAATRPDVVLMDLHLPDMGGVAVTARITAESPECAVLVLSMLDDRASVLSALRAGARGYLVKDAGLDEILSAVRAVAAGQVLLAPTVAGHAIGADPAAERHDPWGFTPRERQLITMLGQGASTGQMATRLGISTKTVRNYLSNLYAKLGVTDRGQAVLAALAHPPAPVIPRQDPRPK